jgi:YD repeat-containing protein
MNNGDNKMTNFLNIIMLELAETGRALISDEYLFFYDLDENMIRKAAREDGVQVRFTYDSNDNLIVTLRKIGLGH